jgi:pimeloyl-ACP methyl ester carboxylesterase
MIQQFRPLPYVASKLALELNVRVFTFDLRYFGLSEGKPRNNLVFKKMEHDWRDSVLHVAERSEVDSERVALYGFSLSGGMSIVTAAKLQQQVRCVFAWLPAMRTDALKIPIGLSSSKLHLLRTISAMGRDAVLARTSAEKAVMIPFIGKTGSFALAASDDAWEELFDEEHGLVVETECGWQNEIPARMIAEIRQGFNPIESVSKLTCPILFTAVCGDKSTPKKLTKEGFEACTSAVKEFHVLPHNRGHASVTYGENLALSIELAVRFFRAQLL